MKERILKNIPFRWFWMLALRHQKFVRIRTSFVSCFGVESNQCRVSSDSVSAPLPWVGSGTLRTRDWRGKIFLFFVLGCCFFFFFWFSWICALGLSTEGIFLRILINYNAIIDDIRRNFTEWIRDASDFKVSGIRYHLLSKWWLCVCIVNVIVIVIIINYYSSYCYYYCCICCFAI